MLVDVHNLNPYSCFASEDVHRFICLASTDKNLSSFSLFVFFFGPAVKSDRLLKFLENCITGKKKENML